MSHSGSTIPLGGTPPATNTVPGTPRGLPVVRQPDYQKLVKWGSGIAGGLLLLIATGYTFLVRHVDPAQAHEAIERRLEFGVLEPGERIEVQLPVARRSARNYFRTTHGIVAATGERLLVLSVEPTPAGAADVERFAVGVRSYAKDTALSVRARAKLFLFRPLLTIETTEGTRRFVVPEQSAATAQALADNVAHRQEALRAQAEEERRLAERAALLRGELDRALSQPRWYVVQRGDALSTIADRFGTSPERLRALNGLASDRIRIGDTLQVWSEAALAGGGE